MELVYIINDKRDFDRFVSIYPTAKWEGSGELTFNYFQTLLSNCNVELRAVLYYLPNGKIQWSSYRRALELTTESPFKYQWGELWPKLSTIDIFRKFLQHHNAYDAFKHNRNVRPSPFVNVYTRQAVYHAFSREYTDQGMAYWVSIGLKWRKLIRDLQLPDECINNFYTQLFLIDGETNDNT